MQILIKSSQKNLTEKKLEGYYKLSQVIQLGRRSPIHFCEHFFGIEFLDAQKYAFMNSWLKQHNLWCITRNGGKSTLSAPLIMAKGVLFPYHNSYILSNVSSQSQETFMKIEKIAKKEIGSFTGLTDFFMNELIRTAANTDGFTHAQSGYKYKLFNGSAVTSLSGEINNNRGKRSNFNLYDESGYTEEEYIAATIPFLIQNSSFKMGGGIDVELIPKEVPNQRLFVSSASSTDSYFYTLYKDYAKRMFLGDKNYFVCDLNCEVMIRPYKDGKIFPAPLINQDEIDSEMRKNKENAYREFYNKFSIDGGDKQVFKRARIIKNSVPRMPVIKNADRQKRRFVFAYDPAHDYDNSVLFVAEIIDDENVGERMEICFGVSFVDVNKKKKTPMSHPEQIKMIRKLLIDFNGPEKADYENIEYMLIDSGAGGGGNSIPDWLMQDWQDSKGNTHKGIIDKEESNSLVRNFPNALDKLKLMSPHKYRIEMFDALLEMLDLDLISFTAEYKDNGYINIQKETGKDIESIDDEGKKYKDKEVILSKVKIDYEEELALINIDLAKEELVNIYRYEGANGNYRYELATEKKSSMKDDRAYCLAMLGWYLRFVRRGRLTKKKKSKISLSKYMFHN